MDRLFHYGAHSGLLAILWMLVVLYRFEGIKGRVFTREV